mgnify:CR=1 FL=1
MDNRFRLLYFIPVVACLVLWLIPLLLLLPAGRAMAVWLIMAAVAVPVCWRILWR